MREDEGSRQDDNLGPDEFEEFVAAALKVDPKGLSGKHRRDGGPVAEFDLDGHGREAAQINDLLLAKGFKDHELTPWWNTPNPSLDGLTPVYVWLNLQEYERVRAVAEAVPER